MIQSVDSLPLAEEINKYAEKSAKTMPVLLEVNVAGEATKFGFKPDEVLAQLARINSLRKIEIHGLMTMAPYTPEPEKVRPLFRRLRELKEASEQSLGAPLTHLSMGMSGDFEIAIEEGSTMVRVGSALFGPRLRSENR
jgi:pyridoxal phosphate enzyme (YggS family)